jgi:high-affinity nickel-transport protein
MIDAVRKLFFNTIITGLGVLVALVVGSTEWLQLLASEFRWQGIFWTFIQDLNFSTLGGMVASLMVLTWATAWFYYRRALQPAE